MRLTVEGCRARQRLLGEVLAERELAGAVLGQREHVYYFTGHLHDPMHAAALLVKADGTSVLAAGEGVDREGLVADDVLEYAPAFLATMHSRQLEEAAAALAPAIPHSLHGADHGGVSILAQAGGELPVDLSPDVLRLRKSKHTDEIAAIRHCIRLTDVMYDAAKTAIGPGNDEVTVFSEIEAAATREAGEFIEGCGNDYRANAMGGKARRRAMNAGELYILDAGPSLHGYWADNCRTFTVDGESTAAQVAAWECIDAVFPILESEIRPGRPAAEVYQVADAYFKENGYAGMSHHLGHGIGMRPHETPELNPHYDAVFEVGDVFTMEPGLYTDDLRAGIRIEENYLLAETGLERLTSYPRALV